MLTVVHPSLSAGRVRSGQYASDDSWGVCGAFLVASPKGCDLRILASNADYPESHGFEHVSVSLPNRCPNWPEMCFAKDLFWGPDECVIQYHPPKADYVNNHNFCLHLWKDTRTEIRRPPSILVGIKGIELA